MMACPSIWAIPGGISVFCGGHFLRLSVSQQNGPIFMGLLYLPISAIIKINRVVVLERNSSNCARLSVIVATMPKIDGRTTWEPLQQKFTSPIAKYWHSVPGNPGIPESLNVHLGSCKLSKHVTSQSNTSSLWRAIQIASPALLNPSAN